MASSLRAKPRSLRALIIGSIAIVLCAGCGGSHSPDSAIPIAPAHRKIHHSPSGVFVDPTQVGAQVSMAVLGADMEVWYDVTEPNMAPSFVRAGMTTTRWPGGKDADRYHWLTNTTGPGNCAGFKPDPRSTFDNFMQDIALPAHLDVSINVNYGSNPKCTAGATANEAAAWVKYANVIRGYNVTWWTVGNEQYEPGATDLHSQPHNPAQYASIVAGYYYPKMKAASWTPIHVCVDGSINNSQWSQTVFSQAKYDCVEVHYYPQQGSNVNDAFLMTQAPQKFTADIKLIKSELAAAGRPGTPIYLGEVGSATAPGDKQEMSITQALYAGQMIGEMLNDGLARATWHSAYGSCQPPSNGGDFASTLYGWQNFGGSMIFSVGTLRNHCSSENVPLGTLMPTAVAFEVTSHFVRNGEHMLAASVTGMPDIRAYATTYNGGYALMLFNLNETTTESVPVTIAGKASGSGGPMWSYDKTLYDASQNNVWNGPANGTLSAWQNSFTLQLPPWSMIVVQTK